MPDFIKLTHKLGNPVWINPAFVETVVTSDNATRVIMTGTSGRFEVQESIQDVMGALGVTIEAPEPAPAQPAPTRSRRTSSRPRSR